MKRIIIGILIVVFVGCVGVIGLIVGMKISAHENRMVIGGMVTSPDGRWLANLNAVIVKKCGSQFFYEFVVYASASEEQRLKTNYSFVTKPAKIVCVPVISEDQLIKRRGEVPFPVQWSEDSKIVETKIEGVEIIIHMGDVK